MKKIICYVLAFVMCITALPQNVSANGGPMERSDYIIGGNISFVDTPDILVEKEDLRITLSPRTSVVTAVYTLKNTGGEKTLEYIFPISSTPEDYDAEVTSSVNRSKVEWIAFYDGSKKLPYKKLDGEWQYEAETINNMDSYFGYRGFMNYYYNVKLDFASNETKTLTVTYKATNAFLIRSEFLYAHSEVSSSYDFSNILFLYDLRPAAAWGNGKASEFNLTVDYSDLLYATDIKLNFDGFKREPSGVFNFTAKDFDFAKQGFISAVIDYPFWLDEREKYQLPNDYLEQVYVSSTLKSSTDAYSARNLFDGDVNTAWAENAKGYGIGETIEFVMQRQDWPAMPTCFVMLNGYVKNEDVYYNNGRVKKLKIESFYMDENGQIDYESKHYGQEQIIEFDDVPYNEIDFNRVLNNGEPIIIDTCSFVRLTILEVYPGLKYEDTCISEIYLMGFYPDGYDKAGYELVNKPIK